MAYTNYTIIPADTTVVVDGQVATGVSMTGIPSGTHAVHWYGAPYTGTVEYNQDPVTGVLPASTTFSDPNDYAVQVAEAEAIIDARNNPVSYYSTVNGNVIDGYTYNLGDLYVSYAVGHPQPANTTTLVPPTPADYQTLYWIDPPGEWQLSTVTPTYTLAEAQHEAKVKVWRFAALGSLQQASIHSTVQLVQAGIAGVGALATADYPTYTLGTYQTFLDGEIATKVATIDAATQVSDLYAFDPTFDLTPP